MHRLLVLLLIAACSSPTAVVPPPPPPPGIARVVLVTDSGVVFSGKALPGEKLVAQVLDSAGHVVTDAVLTASASPGWTVKGDTIIAPKTEGFGSVTITATRTDPSAATSDPAVLASTVNLGTLNLTGSPVMCRVDIAGYLFDDSIAQVQNGNFVGRWYNYQGPLSPDGFPVESLLVQGVTIDAVSYAGSGDWRLTAGVNLFGLVYWKGSTLTYYTTDETGWPGSAGERTPLSIPWSQYSSGDAAVELSAQTPGTFTLTTELNHVPVTTTANNGTYTFDGAVFCSPANDAAHSLPSSSVTLTVH